MTTATEKKSVYDIVTERICDMLSKGVVPWRQPWKSSGRRMPANFVSRRQYSGINAILLSCMPYGSPYYLTYRQAQELGGNVRKGEKGIPVVYWGSVEKQIDDEDSDDENPKTKRIVFARYYTVFNVEQCDGISVDAQPPVGEFDAIPSCQEVVDCYPEPRPAINHGGDRAYYSPKDDAVTMPQPKTFDSPEAYYCVMFHELAHSTGHSTRLARHGITNYDKFGSDQYAREELVAEMAAAFLSAECRIDQPMIENNAAYVAHWMAVLKADPKAVVIAGSQAQKAANWIRNRHESQPATANETATAVA